MTKVPVKGNDCRFFYQEIEQATLFGDMEIEEGFKLLDTELSKAIYFYDYCELERYVEKQIERSIK